MISNSTRRDFLKASAVASTAALAGNLGVHAGGTSQAIRVGLVGCGGRGTGAATDCLHASPDLRLVAIADAFGDRAESCINRLRNTAGIGNRVDVPSERIFRGLDGYQRVIENCDLVLLATPPGFRPQHIQAAINARKHLFTEKPVAVDGPGIRTVLAAFEEANRHNLTVVAGTQRRYQTGYLEAMRRIHGGDIGQIVAGRCYWNQGSLWSRAREANWSDVEWQIRNWLYFSWLSGDHVCEQHVHNLDVINWALGNSHPVRAVGLGGRQVRTSPEHGHIFDHHAVDLEYPNDVHVMSMCRQIAGCENNITEAVVGTRGNASLSAGGSRYVLTGERAWTLPRGQDNAPYRAEHVALLESIRGRRERINDLKNVAESTLTAILCRMATYTGRAVTWDQALNSQQSLVPANLTLEMNLPVAPVAMPGQTPLS